MNNKISGLIVFVIMLHIIYVLFGTTNQYKINIVLLFSIPLTFYTSFLLNKVQIDSFYSVRSLPLMLWLFMTCWFEFISQFLFIEVLLIDFMIVAYMFLFNTHKIKSFNGWFNKSAALFAFFHPFFRDVLC